MRIDQYLKIARIVKKRSVSKELANQDRILINGRKAKPSSEVKIGDEVDCVFGNRHLKIRVLAIAENIKKKAADDSAPATNQANSPQAAPGSVPFTNNPDDPVTEPEDKPATP